MPHQQRTYCKGVCAPHEYFCQEKLFQGYVDCRIFTLSQIPQVLHMQHARLASFWLSFLDPGWAHQLFVAKPMTKIFFSTGPRRPPSTTELICVLVDFDYRSIPILKIFQLTKKKRRGNVKAQVTVIKLTQFVSGAFLRRKQKAILYPPYMRCPNSIRRGTTLYPAIPAKRSLQMVGSWQDK